MVNWVPDPQQPYVGTSAFAHKAGLHASALARRADAYEHIDPVAVGNGTRFVVSEMAGRSSIELKARELGLDMDGATIGQLIETLKRLEYEGYQFEVADASLELWMRAALGWEQPWFRIESFRVEVGRYRSGGAPAGTAAGVSGPRRPDDDAMGRQCEATIKLWVGDQRRITVGEGNGPVNALHNALLAAVGDHYPQIARIRVDRLQGAGPGHSGRHRRGHPGADRLQRRRPHLDHHRRVGEHRGGLLGGPRRLHRLGPTPQQRHSPLRRRLGGPTP